MMASKLSCVVPTYHKGGFGPWFELDWTGRPNHSMAARHVVLAERKLMNYVYAVDLFIWIRDEDRDIAYTFYGMQPLLFDGTQRCLTGDARLWWLTQGELAIQGGSWAAFRTLIIARYGPLPDEEANMSYHDPYIYNDMYMRRWLNYVVEWQAYPNESTDHYCRRDGLPPEVNQFIRVPILVISLEHMIDAIMEEEIIAYKVQVAEPEDDYLLVLVNDAGIPEPLFEGGPVLPEDPIPAVPLQEAEANADNNKVDLADFLAVPEDQLEDPPIIIIAREDDEEDIEEEFEEEWEEFEGMEEEIENIEDDSEEILLGDDDGDVFSDVTTEYIV
ncbi:hypothetical protein TIFTF001_031623 [Ficus carica]|uniref:Uncharacterized protein n=1 Tax=Ficus carica TaxID=3494 RepID=A0AA88J6K9_FICCA|nr:hypothetical protein TIFTF001_031623 [Ficus carica]